MYPDQKVSWTGSSNATPERTMQIPMQCAEMEKRLEELSMNVAALTNRLDLVRVERPILAGANGDKPRETLAPLAERMAMFNTRLQDANNGLRQLLDTLEV